MDGGKSVTIERVGGLVEMRFTWGTRVMDVGDAARLGAMLTSVTALA